jgi:hypothetical protein
MNRHVLRTGKMTHMLIGFQCENVKVWGRSFGTLEWKGR